MEPRILSCADKIGAGFTGETGTESNLAGYVDCLGISFCKNISKNDWRFAI